MGWGLSGFVRGNAMFAALIIVSVSCFTQMCIFLCFRDSVSTSLSSAVKVSQFPVDR